MTCSGGRGDPSRCPLVAARASVPPEGAGRPGPASVGDGARRRGHDCHAVARPALPAGGAGEGGRGRGRPQRRFSDQWRSVLRLPPVRRQPYVNSGLVALPFDAGTRLMRLVEEALPAVDVGRSFWTHGAEDDPFLFLDQDVINALLASEFPRDLLAVLPSRLAPQPPFEGLSVSAGKPLRLRYPDGEEPFAVHHTMRKPWLDRIPANAYSELLGSLLLDPKLPIRLRPGDVPGGCAPGASVRSIAPRSGSHSAADGWPDRPVPGSRGQRRGRGVESVVGRSGPDLGPAVRRDRQRGRGHRRDPDPEPRSAARPRACRRPGPAGGTAGSDRGGRLLRRRDRFRPGACRRSAAACDPPVTETGGGACP